GDRDRNLFCLFLVCAGKGVLAHPSERIRAAPPMDDSCVFDRDCGRDDPADCGVVLCNQQTYWTNAAAVFWPGVLDCILAAPDLDRVVVAEQLVETGGRGDGELTRCREQPEEKTAA